MPLAPEIETRAQEEGCKSLQSGSRTAACGLQCQMSGLEVPGKGGVTAEAGR